MIGLMISAEVPDAMPLASLFHRTIATTRKLSPLVQHVATLEAVGLTFAVRRAADPLLLGQYPFMLSLFTVLAVSSAFSGPCGIVATGASAAVAAFFYLPPLYDVRVETAADIAALVMFLLLGTSTALIIETLHHSMEAHRDSERHRTLLLAEFRHRTRNDLQSLVGLLLLRARSAPSAAVRCGLREAANHAMGLSRVHARLERAGIGDASEPVVDTREFIEGLTADLERWQNGDGLRPVALVVSAEKHQIGTERAVQLGLVVNELVTNALKYAFPEDRTGTIALRFARDGNDFVLAVTDDGIGMSGNAAPPASGLGTRLLRALAAQLRGTIQRVPGPHGGVHAELRFPCYSPGSAIPNAHRLP